MLKILILIYNWMYETHVTRYVTQKYSKDPKMCQMRHQNTNTVNKVTKNITVKYSK